MHLTIRSAELQGVKLLTIFFALILLVIYILGVILVLYSRHILILRFKILFISNDSGLSFALRIQLRIYFAHKLFPLGLPWVLLHLIAQIDIMKWI
jgi:hypothetical protein